MPGGRHPFEGQHPGLKSKRAELHKRCGDIGQNQLSPGSLIGDAECFFEA